MRLTTEELRQAAKRKRKAADVAEGSRQRARQTTPVRPAAQSPRRPSPPPAQDGERPELRRAVDLTVDSPGEQARIAEAEAAAETIVGQIQRSVPAADVAEVAPLATREDAPTETDAVREAAPVGESTAPGVEGAESSGFPAISPCPSVMYHGKRAENLMKQVCLPEFQMELHSRSAGTFFRDALVAQLWTTNSIVAMRTVLSKTDKTLRATRQALEEAESRAGRAEKTADAIRAEAAEAAGRMDAAYSAMAADLEAARDRATMEAERARIVSAELEMVNTAIKARDLQIEAFVNVVKATEARAASAEARAAKAEEEARAAREELLPAGAKAVEEFRASEAFRLEVADAAAEAFIQGFEDGRDTVGRLFSLSGLEGLGPGGGDQEADGAPTDAEGTPTRNAPAEASPSRVDAHEEPTGGRQDSAGASQ